MLETTDKDAKYDAVKANQRNSAKAKGVLRGAGYARGGGVGAVSPGGMKSGGKTKPKAKAVKKIDGGEPKGRPDKAARGGSKPSGHHTRVNINVGAGQAEKEQAMKTGMALGAHMAVSKMGGGGPRPGAGAAMQARPMAPPPGAGMAGPPPPAGGPPPMANRGGAFKRGGKVGGKKVPGVTNVSTGSGGGEGRLEKIRKYGTKPKK